MFGRAAKLSLLNFLSLFRDLQESRNRHDSVGGGVVPEFSLISRSRLDSVGGGGSSRILPCSPEAEQIGWCVGGGFAGGIFRDLLKRNQMFTPHLVIFMG